MSELEIQASATGPGAGRAPASARGGFGRMRVTVMELAAVLVAVLLLTAAIFPRLLAPGDPLAIDPLAAFGAPSWEHWFGTDESGRDIYTRVVDGARDSLLIGLTATLIGLGLGAVLGTIAGTLGAAVDFTVNRFLEVLFAFPGLLLALLFILVFGPGPGSAIVAVGLSTAPGYARIIRAQLLRVRSSAFVEAATVQGLSRRQILARHILPNTLAPLLVLGTLGVGQAIVWAAALSYLGLGAQPPAAEWGAMLSAGRTYISSFWWMTFFPGLFIVLSAAATTLLGRAIQQRGRES